MIINTTLCVPVTIDQPASMLVCPGRKVSLNCSQEPPRSIIQWKIWCQCRSGSNIESCRVTCNPMASATVNSRDELQHGNVCTEHTPAFTYEHSFTAVRDQDNNTLVPSSVLSIAVPPELQQQNNTRIICLECNSQPYAYLQVLGTQNSFPY